MTSALTPRQQAILDFLADYIAERGYSPSLDEIAAGVGLAGRGPVAYQIKTLVAKGYVRHQPLIPRSLVPDPSTQCHRCNNLR